MFRRWLDRWRAARERARERAVCAEGGRLCASCEEMDDREEYSADAARIRDLRANEAR